LRKSMQNIVHKTSEQYNYLRHHITAGRLLENITCLFAVVKGTVAFNGRMPWLAEAPLSRAVWDDILLHQAISGFRRL